LRQEGGSTDIVLYGRARRFEQLVKVGLHYWDPDATPPAYVLLTDTLAQAAGLDVTVQDTVPSWELDHGASQQMRVVVTSEAGLVLDTRDRTFTIDCPDVVPPNLDDFRIDSWAINMAGYHVLSVEVDQDIPTENADYGFGWGLSAEAAEAMDPVWQGVSATSFYDDVVTDIEPFDGNLFLSLWMRDVALNVSGPFTAVQAVLRPFAVESFAITALDSVDVGGTWFIAATWEAETNRLADDAEADWQETGGVWDGTSFAPADVVIARIDTTNIETDGASPIEMRFRATEGVVVTDYETDSMVWLREGEAPPPDPFAVLTFGITDTDSVLDGGTWYIRAEWGATTNRDCTTAEIEWSIDDITYDGASWTPIGAAAFGREEQTDIEVDAVDWLYMRVRGHEGGDWSDWVYDDVEWERVDPGAPPDPIPDILFVSLVADSTSGEDPTIRLTTTGEADAEPDTARYRASYRSSVGWQEPSSWLNMGITGTDLYAQLVTDLDTDADVDSLRVEVALGRLEPLAWGDGSFAQVPWVRATPIDMWIASVDTSIVPTDTLRVTVDIEADPAAEMSVTMAIKCSGSWDDDWPEIETDGEVTEFGAIWDLGPASGFANCDSLRAILFDTDGVPQDTMWVEIGTPGEEPLGAPAGLDVTFYPGDHTPVPRGFEGEHQEPVGGGCDPDEGFYLTWLEPAGGLPEDWGYKVVYSDNAEFEGTTSTPYCDEPFPLDHIECVECSEPGESHYFRLYLVAACDGGEPVEMSYVEIEVLCPEAEEPWEGGAPEGLDVTFYPGDPLGPLGLQATWEEDLCKLLPVEDGFNVEWTDPFGGLPAGYGFHLVWSLSVVFEDSVSLFYACGEDLDYQYSDCFECTPGGTSYYRLWLVEDCEGTPVYEYYDQIAVICPDEPGCVMQPTEVTLTAHRCDDPQALGVKWDHRTSGEGQEAEKYLVYISWDEGSWYLAEIVEAPTDSVYITEHPDPLNGPLPLFCGDAEYEGQYSVAVIGVLDDEIEENLCGEGPTEDGPVWLHCICVLQMEGFTATAKPDTTDPGFWIRWTFPEDEDCDLVPDFYNVYVYVGEEPEAYLVAKIDWEDTPGEQELYWHEFAINGGEQIPCDEDYFFWVEHGFDVEPDPMVYACFGEETEAYEYLSCEFSGLAPDNLEVEFYPQDDPYSLDNMRYYPLTFADGAIGFGWSPNRRATDNYMAIMVYDLPAWPELWFEVAITATYPDTFLLDIDGYNATALEGEELECDTQYTFAIRGLDTSAYPPHFLYGKTSNSMNEWRVCCDVPDNVDVAQLDVRLDVTWDTVGDPSGYTYKVRWAPIVAPRTLCEQIPPEEYEEAENISIGEYTIDVYDDLPLVNGTTYCIEIIAVCPYGIESDPALVWGIPNEP